MDPATTSHTTPSSVATASGNTKRKRTDSSDLELGILECFICNKPLSLPVSQCEKGHTACTACCQLPSSKIKDPSRPWMSVFKCPSCQCEMRGISRNLARKLVSCKNARYGCKKMMEGNKRAKHEMESCRYQPFPCPVPGCMQEGSKHSIPLHLTKDHGVPTIKPKNSGKATFTMSSDAHSPRFVIVKGERLYLKGEHLYLVHHEIDELMGDVFFCTYFKRGCERLYDLSVRKHPGRKMVTMVEAEAEDVRCKDKWKTYFLLFPFQGDAQRHRSYSLVLKNFRCPSDEEGYDPNYSETEYNCNSDTGSDSDASNGSDSGEH